MFTGFVIVAEYYIDICRVYLRVLSDSAKVMLVYGGVFASAERVTICIWATELNAELAQDLLQISKNFTNLAIESSTLSAGLY